MGQWENPRNPKVKVYLQTFETLKKLLNNTVYLIIIIIYCKKLIFKNKIVILAFYLLVKISCLINWWAINGFVPIAVETTGKMNFSTIREDLRSSRKAKVELKHPRSWEKSQVVTTLARTVPSISTEPEVIRVRVLGCCRRCPRPGIKWCLLILNQLTELPGSM